MKLHTIGIFVLACLFISCTRNKPNQQEVERKAENKNLIGRESFGMDQQGRAVHQYTMRNSSGMEVKVINYGGIITQLIVPDKDGKMEDVVLGYDSLQPYLQSSPYFGAVVGRYGNRIANGTFSLDGKQFTLAKNNNGQHLHGGVKGFDKVYWEIEPVDSSAGAALRLHYVSPDGEEGYPGNLDIYVIYYLKDDNELVIDYRATTDQLTVVNLTQHSYFNLSGNAKRDILGHELQILADRFVPVNKVLIPTGELAPVTGTPFDFRNPKPIGRDIGANHEQLAFGKGYDHCWVLNKANNDMTLAAVLTDSISGRRMEVSTTEPGLQFYSGNFLDGSNIGKSNTPYTHRMGLCLETEHFPDSPNQPAFPSVQLRPGETYHSRTAYRFTLDR